MNVDSRQSPVAVSEQWSGPRHRTLGSLFEAALLIRRFEQRLLELFAEGSLFGTVHTCIGQELTGLAVAEYLEAGDLVFSNHRCHGHYLARTGDVDGLMAEIMGKETGICGGRGGSQHICAHGFYSNGVQGGIMPVSAGLALAQTYAATGNIVVAFVGDGTLGEGVLYEALNIASKWQLPLLVVLENNMYAQSTSQSETLAGDICARAAAFGIETFHTSTWRPTELLNTAERCVGAVRGRQAPVFLQIDTYRLMAHSKGDDDRDPAEVQAYWKRDPLAAFIEQYPEADRVEREIGERLDRAVRLASAAPFSPASAGDTRVTTPEPLRWSPLPPRDGRRLVESIRDSFARHMARDPRIVMIGEDIRSPYGGAFKATKGLSDAFPDRVRNTPISEAAIVGVGVGMAMAGMRPVCEIMFGDFLTLAADQIVNHASKFPYMYNDRVSVPLVIRTPMGGKRGYGPTHSQSLEKHFLGLPQTRMLALNPRYDAGTVYDTLLSSIDRTTLVIENKLMYALRDAGPMPGFTLECDNDLFPTVRLRPDRDPDLTILSYGGMLTDVEQAVVSAFDEEEIICEVVCPIQLYPLNPSPILESVRRTRRLLVVEEGLSFSAFGAEVIAEVCELAPGTLSRVRRLAAPRHPIPSCGPLEKQLLPGAASIARAITEIVSGG